MISCFMFTSANRQKRHMALKFQLIRKKNLSSLVKLEKDIWISVKKFPTIQGKRFPLFTGRFVFHYWQVLLYDFMTDFRRIMSPN